jgi:hypothetical protein
VHKLKITIENITNDYDEYKIKIENDMENNFKYNEEKNDQVI